ncbi:uncharacterized protein CLBA1 isoform X3 [Aptenodytes patagonicus]|uniref:uncharacterized protein CLBA1 isoform X3 n=1 Tax=Aptenodytes patagonicus TaxID=9234 RepID=UPI003FA02F0F
MQNLSLVENLTNTDTSHRISLKDLAVEVGGTSLDESDCNSNERTNNEEIINLEVMQQSLPGVYSKGRSCEGFSESSCSTVEPTGSWGDFEGFRESLDKSERFSHSLEVLVKSTKTSRADTDLSSGRCRASAGHFCSEPSLHSRIQEAWSSLNEANHSYEDIFKLGFPEVFVSQSRESIRSLDQVLDTNNEDVGIPELTKNQLWTFWRARMTSLRNQMLKLSVSPDSRHGHLFTCNLFLKTTSSDGNMQYVTIPRKKHIFAAHNLKMKFFSSDVC